MPPRNRSRARQVRGLLDPRHLVTLRGILRVCHELQQLTGSDVTLVTADTALRLRAQAQGLTVLSMPVKYERPRPDLQAAGKT